MHSRNYSNYLNNSCSVCSNPQPSCTCHSHHNDNNCVYKPPMSEVKITQFDCKNTAGYASGKCVEHKGAYYISAVDGNNVDPTIGSKLSPPIWYGPFDLCSLMKASSSSEQGPQGVQGVQGAAGIQGNIGPQGVAGIQGIRGIDGPQGSTGNTGPQGIIGEKGLQGEQGSRGPEGIQGSVGAQGIQGVQGAFGIQGPQGVNGEQGIQGVQGLNGPQGIQGIQGINGAQGQQGVQGTPYNPTLIDNISNYNCLPGQSSLVVDLSTGIVYSCSNGSIRELGEYIQGPQGNTGAQGIQGIQGVTGATGPQGSTGSQGAQGVKGEQGIQGAQGATGVQGVQGPIGLQGVIGVQGPMGVQGAQGQRGIQGIQGDQGIQGAEGRQGIQGNVGPQGSQGETGAQGAQGQRGIQGVQGPAGGPQGPQGETGAQGAQGSQGSPGKDYDPNCQAASVIEIICANTKGNITLVFEEVDGTQDKHEMPAAVFKPTNKDILNAKEVINSTTNEKFWTTTNHINSNITWFKKPTVGMMFVLSDFKPGEMTDFNKQAIRFDVIDLNGGCLGYGLWELLIECNNCNCVIPTIIVETDSTGKQCAVWNDGKGNIVKLGLCNTSSCGAIDQYQGCDPLLAKRWEEDCKNGVDIGYFTYKDAYWLNVESNNTNNPETLEGWYGPYGSFELIQQHINLVVNDRVAVIVDNILKMRGLV